MGLSKIYLTEMERYNDMRELTLREIQMTSLNVLIEVDQICKDLGLRYFLMYGTLIGAIRHKGFIPWDDDLDIGMPRKDFDQLVLFFDSEYSGALRMCTRANSEEYLYGIPRICDRRYKYVALEKTYKKKVQFVEKPEMGVFIDVYPIDNFGLNEQEALSLKKRCNRMNVMYYRYKTPSSSDTVYKILIKCLISKFMYLLKGNNWNKTIDKEIMATITERTSEENNLVGVPAWTDKFVVYEKDWFSEQVLIEFQNFSFPSPKNYQKVLEAEYGDYLSLPPEDERKPQHNYKIFDPRV